MLISLSQFSARNSNSINPFFYSNQNFDERIAENFYTKHKCHAVVSCVNICSDMIIMY